MLDAKSLFSESYYQAEYPAVASAVASGAFSSGFDHFNKFGKFEGRDPGPFYDDSYYLSQYPGVAQAVRTGAMSSGFDHFILYGQNQNLSPSTMFRTGYYLNNNQDVADAVSKSKDTVTGDALTPIEHFVKNGLDEGRASSKGFDVSYYLANNPDLEAAKLTNKQAAEHFALYGVDEGRQPNQSFNVNSYLAQNPGLKSAGLTNQQAFEHMMTNGLKEDRPGTAGTVGGFQVYKAPRIPTSIPITAFFPLPNPPAPGPSSVSLNTPLGNPSNGDVGCVNLPLDRGCVDPATPSTGTQTLQQKFSLYNDTPYNIESILVRSEPHTAEDIAKGAVTDNFTWVSTPPDPSNYKVGSASDIFNKISVTSPGGESQVEVSDGIIRPGEGFIVFREYANQATTTTRGFRTAVYTPVS
jgi:hypothetical protein